MKKPIAIFFAYYESGIINGNSTEHDRCLLVRDLKGKDILTALFDWSLEQREEIEKQTGKIIVMRDIKLIELSNPIQEQPNE